MFTKLKTIKLVFFLLLSLLITPNIIAQNSISKIFDQYNVQINTTVDAPENVYNITSKSTTSSVYLTASYPFNGNANDVTTNGFDGTVADATLCKDRFGNDESAYYFNDNDDITISTLLPDSLNNQYTFSVWIKPDNNIWTGTWGTILFLGENSTHLGTALEYNHPSATQYRINHATYDDALDLHVDGDIDDMWSHFVAVYDGATRKTYINGVLIGEDSYSALAITNMSLKIGRREHSFLGAIDDIEIYSSALNSNQIDSLYHINNWDSQECLAANFLFNNSFDSDNTTNYVLDNFAGEAEFTNDRLGNENSACELDTSAAFNLEASTLNLNGNLSYSMWFKIDTLVEDTNFIAFSINEENDFLNFVIGITQENEIIYGQDSIDGTNEFISTNYFINPQQTYHIALTKDTLLKEWSLYINNQLVHQQTYVPIAIQASIGDMEFFGTGMFGGIIDDINIYRCVISPETIDSLYYVGDWNPQACLVATYLLNNNIIDNSGNGYTESDFADLYQTYIPDRFNNANSALDLSDSTGFSVTSTLFNMGNSMSFSFWLNINDLILDTTFITVMLEFENDFIPFLLMIDNNENNLSFGHAYNSQEISELNTYLISTDFSFNLHQNYHIVITRDTNIQAYKLYIDNQLISVNNYINTIDSYMGNTNTIIFGGLEDMHMSIDDINLYRCAIDSSTVDSLFHINNWNGDCLDLAINSINVNDATCGLPNGTGFVSVTGGSGSYSYLWSNGETSNIATALEAGTNSVQVTDNVSNCFVTEFFNTNNSNAPEILINTITNLSCYGADNGEIIIDVTGGVGSYTYNWSNGNHNSSISNLEAGTYELTVIDEASCMASQSFEIIQPNELEISFNTTNSACNTADGSIEAIVNGGTPNYTYSWGTGTDTIMNLSAGSYPITVTDINSCTVEATAMLSDNGAPTITVDSITAGNCNIDGAIYVTISNATSPSFEWNGSASATEDLLSATANTTHMLTVHEGNCIAMQDVYVPYMLPQAQEICIVTVDSATGANLVVWEKPSTTNIKGYNIYRETSITDQYVLIGHTPYDSLGVFVDDMAYTWIRSYKYKIATVDNCDMVSEMSFAHKTIHVSLNIGYLENTVNLIWDNYEGFQYSSFNILRYDIGTGWGEVLGSPLSNNLHSITADVISTTSMYAITIDKPGNACLSSKTSGGPYSHSFSNIDDYSIETVIENAKTFDNINVYPNPSTGIINIEANNIVQIKITDSKGQTVLTKQINSNTATFNLNNNAKGIYFIKISGADYVTVKKLVIQ